MNERSRRLVAYLHDCYRADNREQSLWNIFDGKLSRRMVLEGEELIASRVVEALPLPDADAAAELRKAAWLVRAEKTLYYTTLFVCGTQQQQSGSPQRYCAPLFFFPAELSEQDALRITGAERRTNLPLLELLCGNREQALALLDRVAREVPPGTLTFQEAATLHRLFREFAPELNSEALYLYPELHTEKALRQAMKQPACAGLHLVPGAALVLVAKSRESRGVLSELNVLKNVDVTSAPLAAVLGQNGSARNTRKNTAAPRTMVPAVLSDTQKRIIQNAAQHTLSLVIGPPGTGKSFTIAAMALDHMNRGESVLIASKMNHAVDVVGNKIEEMLGTRNLVVRGGSKEYLRDLKEYISDMLYSFPQNPGLKETRRFRPVSRLGRYRNRPPSYDDYLSKPYYAVNESIHAPKKLQAMLRALQAELDKLEHSFEKKNHNELGWGAVLAQDRTVWNALHRLWIRMRIGLQAPQWAMLEKIETLLEEHRHISRALIRAHHSERIAQALNHHRRELNTFLKALRARSGHRQEQFFAEIDFSVLLATFPIWLVNLNDVNKVLPLETELFDLAIIDEATQCDIASCLPIFARAKRVVVCGDPKQLRHLSFLPRERQAGIARRHRLGPLDTAIYNYCESSILDAVGDVLPGQDAVVMLDEHYRSVPPIIEFSNRAFYNNSLRIMTQNPQSDKREDALSYRPVRGTRAESGINQAEAEALLQNVLEVFERQAGFAPQACLSVGILSPFRNQVDFITEQLEKHIRPEVLQKHKVLCGTAHTFQGEERDLMFLSFVLDKESKHASHYFLNKADVFNVAITRARLQQFVYSSLEPAAIPWDTWLRKYLHSLAAIPAITAHTSRSYGDDFLHDVCAFLEEHGLSYHVAWPIAGMEVDIVVRNQGRSYGIDLIGHPGPFVHHFSLERFKMFYRAGLPIFALPYTRWLLMRDECTSALREFLNRE